MAQTRRAMGWIGDCSQLLLGRAEAEAQFEPVNLGQEGDGQEGGREDRRRGHAKRLRWKGAEMLGARWPEVVILRQRKIISPCW